MHRLGTRVSARRFGRAARPTWYEGALPHLVIGADHRLVPAVASYRSSGALTWQAQRRVRVRMTRPAAPSQFPSHSAESCPGRHSPSTRDSRWTPPRRPPTRAIPRIWKACWGDPSRVRTPHPPPALTRPNAGMLASRAVPASGCGLDLVSIALASSATAVSRSRSRRRHLPAMSRTWSHAIGALAK